MRLLIPLLLAALYLTPHQSEAACDSGADAANQSQQALSGGILYTGSCADDNDVLIITGDVSRYESCSVVSTAGVVDLVVSLNGSTYTTSALSLIDLGATDTNPVLVTVALQLYAFPVVFQSIKVLQNGATDATAHLFCK